jgi:hypothetical protein
MNDQEKQNEELEFNRRNREDYEQLMEESSTKLDGYWDKNNWFVRILLLALFVVIVGGCIIVFGAYFAGN